MLWVGIQIIYMLYTPCHILFITLSGLILERVSEDCH